MFYPLPHALFYIVFTLALVLNAGYPPAKVKLQISRFDDVKFATCVARPSNPFQNILLLTSGSGVTANLASSHNVTFLINVYAFPGNTRVTSSIAPVYSEYDHETPTTNTTFRHAGPIPINLGRRRSSFVKRQVLLTLYKLLRGCFTKTDYWFKQPMPLVEDIR
ncbi:hypothetical protein GALMADRAFT_143216 [Galerina marginata CBS 339.88]|uniref:Uncharacterized protein n=1 Tax=Galerina marginata (strain CBS 339.88) TaxID=685588 RepID=A0A067SXG1_GALM3|nr:hypothetical protein GALMADRAFT_143216 [Galerina marginata CBS 339.88]